MSEDVKSAVSEATLHLLQPLARFLLEARIGIGELSTLARRAYVRVAAEADSGPAARRTNISRIAARTGLTRVEIRSLLAEEHGAKPRAHRGAVRAERVLFGWWNDPQFQDRTGAPEALKLKGARRSFSALVRRYGGDGHNTAPILDELLRSKAVRERSDGSLEVLRRTCVSVSWDAEGIAALGEELAEHFETLLYNLKNPDRPRFARRVLCTHLDAHAARVLIPELAEHAEIFLEGAQEALHHPKQIKRTKEAGSALKFSVAVQFCQEQATPAESAAQERRPGRDRRVRRQKRRSGDAQGVL